MYYLDLVPFRQGENPAYPGEKGPGKFTIFLIIPPLVSLIKILERFSVHYLEPENRPEIQVINIQSPAALHIQNTQTLLVCHSSPVVLPPPAVEFLSCLRAAPLLCCLSSGIL
ncbi:hypothetical protein Q3G72_010305 [Acer saccharum]|nr:hypothetical protein Q3G72_010305 [Acer saccharum]